MARASSFVSADGCCNPVPNHLVFVVFLLNIKQNRRKQLHWCGLLWTPMWYWSPPTIHWNILRYLTGDWNFKEETLGSGGFDQTISTVIWHLMQLIINDFTIACAIRNPKSPCCPTVRVLVHCAPRHPAITSSSARLHRFSLYFERKENQSKAPSVLQGQEKNTCEQAI